MIPQTFVPVQRMSLHTWWGIDTPLAAIAIVLTSFRLFHRLKIRKLWWDDLFAFLSMLCEIVYLPTPFLKQPLYGRRPSPSILKKQILFFWFSSVLFPLVIWTARISIGMSIARLIAPKSRMRYFVYALNVCFGILLFALLFHRVYICASSQTWQSGPAVFCYLGNVVGIASIITDVISDAFLVIIPINLLLGMRLPKRQRIMLLTIFASSALSTLVGIAYTVFVFKSVRHRQTWGYTVQCLAGVKAAVTLMVCNLLVVVTYVYRRFRNEDDDSTISSPSENHTKSGIPTLHSTRPLSTDGGNVLTSLGTMDMAVQTTIFTEISTGLGRHPTILTHDTKQHDTARSYSRHM